MVGDILRKEREKQNLTVKDIEAGTSIRALYITAIEENNYKVLPGEVYVKGFIKTYANFLNLDGNAVVAQYKKENMKETEVVASESVMIDETQSLIEKQPKPVVNTGIPDTKIKSSVSKKFLAGIVAVVLVSGGFYLAFSSDNESDKKQIVAEPKVTISEKKVESKPLEKQATDVKVPVNEIVITAKFTGNCWTQVEVDDRVVYEATVKSGESLSWKGQKVIKIKAGNAGAIEINQNGRDLGKLGGTGEVVEKDFLINVADKKK